MNATLAWRDQVLHSVVRDPIRQDPRSKAGNLLGYSTDYVFHNIIKYGQANFDQPFDEVSGLDKARLYALLNQPGHLCELDEAFGQIFSDSCHIQDPYVFDIGCGPFTAGLSLAGILGSQHVIHYFGIDLYASMRSLGQKIADQAQALGALSRYSQCSFHDCLDAVPRPMGARNNPKLFIASYLLASSSIEVTPLVKSIQNVADTFSRGPSLLLYTNTTHPVARSKYPTFKQHLEAAGFICTSDGQGSVLHKRNPRTLHYALFHKPACF